MRYRARWVFPGESPPLENGVVTVAQGRIRALEQNAHGSVRDLGNVALIPGLINAHTHLEFSRRADPIEPRANFAQWIQAVIAQRRDSTTDTKSCIEQGLIESRQQGITGLAEIATSDWIFDIPRENSPSPRCLIFREILGLRQQGVVEQLFVAEKFLQRARESQLHDVGLSPHAPYSLHPELFRGLCDLAVTHSIPLAMHLAESPEEMQLLQSGSGPLVELFTQMGLWQPGIIQQGTRPLSYLKELSRAPRALVVHGTYLDSLEIDFLKKHPHLSVVYCPRTHAAMQSGTHPWRTMLGHGINVTLGTDSRASNPDLSLWGELAFLSTQFPDFPASHLLALATVNAARALGWQDCGAILPGKTADLCVVELPSSGIDNPEAHLFSGTIRETIRANA